MKPVRPNPLNLLRLTPLQRQVIVYLTREGPADAPALALALNQDLAEIQPALAALAQQGSIQLSAGGLAEVTLGQTRRRTLPARLWPALFATNRLYSVQEIATLCTAVPILQFARAKLGEFADHGPGHAFRVKSFATQLAYILGLSATEQHLLRAAALFHDVGNIIERERHHVISQETVEKLTAAGQLPFSAREGALVGLLCRWHRQDYEPDRQDEIQGQAVRTGLLASILRVADAMDIDYRRSDYGEQFSRIVYFFFPRETPYWDSVKEILGVRIRCTQMVKLQVFTKGQLQDNIQIGMLRKDLGRTPLNWSIQAISVGIESPPYPALKEQKPLLALLVFPFEPHSLVMAALSRRHLGEAGYCVELLCYADTPGGTAWLWGEALAEAAPAAFARLVVIGDRPDLTITPQKMAALGAWQTAGVAISLLNRHEANWTHLPELLRCGAEVILGGDWAYFWGDNVTLADLGWGRIAALATRDPTQSSVGLTPAEEALTRGLLQAVYNTASRPDDDRNDWTALAKPILDRIGADDRAYFVKQANKFVANYATSAGLGQVKGRVILFVGQQAPAKFPPAYYWALEAAIEGQGRRPERGLHFNTPYAIAAWPDGDSVELLALNHWREEAATPIRLLYPTDLGPPPQGNESTIRVRLPARQAELVVQALVEACNQIEM